MKTRNPKESKIWRDFGISLAIFGALAATLLLRLNPHFHIHLPIILIVACWVIGAALLKPGHFRMPYSLAKRISEPLSRFASKILLGTLFWFVLFPTAIFLRTIGKDLLNCKRPPSDSVSSYWQQARKFGPLDKLF